MLFQNIGSATRHFTICTVELTIATNLSGAVVWNLTATRVQRFRRSTIRIHEMRPQSQRQYFVVAFALSFVEAEHASFRAIIRWSGTAETLLYRVYQVLSVALGKCLQLPLSSHLIALTQLFAEASAQTFDVVSGGDKIVLCLVWCCAVGRCSVESAKSHLHLSRATLSVLSFDLCPTCIMKLATTVSFINRKTVSANTTIATVIHVGQATCVFVKMIDHSIKFG